VQFQICAVLRKSVPHPRPHVHVVRVLTEVPGDEPPERREWTFEEAFAAMNNGAIFYTVAKSTSSLGMVSRQRCPHCGEETLEVDGGPYEGRLESLSAVEDPARPSSLHCQTC
jgi:hypothetical protein